MQVYIEADFNATDSATSVFSLNYIAFSFSVCVNTNSVVYYKNHTL